MQEEKKSLIETRDLSIGYHHPRHGQKVLHSNICVKLEAGEFACVLGPNGSGKSTLLQTLCGFLPRLSGEVCIAGNQIDKVSNRQMSLLASVVLTERVTVSNMTVSDLVSLGRTPYTGFFGRLKSRDQELVSEAIRSVGLEGFEERLITNMSDGERQKAMIAKALVQETPLIVLDEPTAFLDLPSRIEIMHLLRKLAHQHNKAILLSTHDLDLALQMADKVWLLAEGRKMETGTPEDLVLTNEFRRFFEREGILFDNDTGQFTVEKQKVKTIRIVGKGIEYKWVSRALARRGFAASDEPFSGFQVEVKSDGKREYLLTCPDGKIQKLRTIEDLLTQLEYEEATLLTE
ncbi:iron complex transport system ATP-binding protein [Marinilabilia salmonicolor]|jgi:iron complex transport system ATP-binding protein|uniref:ABC transporter ATP-binding protein n=1 Tax=Marinilabilia salmonicolor TaxID=989 RepID=UPI000D06C5F1|nr:ABC transporter ATP-binding protein [Marinilabilia salmonicolor]PRZ00203.1 iron complex transport system ATP-binding protein [Marinilabilia salmonicolor]